ncbi:MAG: IPT/TIG domain-containing protein, partial [Acidobacteriota bacterium]
MSINTSLLSRTVGLLRLAVYAVVLAATVFIFCKTRLAHGQSGAVKVTTVSAASFLANESVAPDSIVAAFGANLATGVAVAPGRPLSTQLAGTTVKVNDRLAPLFFVSPSQINYLIPVGTAAGEARVVVTSGDGTVSQGTVQVAPVAPAIFTANASGQDVAAAVALRVKANGSQTYEPVSRFDATLKQSVTVPIELGPEGERVFLILFLTGVRGAEGGNRARKVQLVIGGIEVPHTYAGPTGDFDGLDQLNAEIPRALLGRGGIGLAVAANRELSAAEGKQDDFFTSNLVEIEIGSPQGGPRIDGFEPATVLAGQLLTIRGSGFSTVPGQNLVRIGGIETTEALFFPTPERLVMRVPFGADTRAVTVRTTQGEATSAEPVKLRTSVSGFVEDTNFKPLPDVAVKVLQTDLGAKADQDGTFLLPDSVTGMDVPKDSQVVEISPAGLPASLPFPTIRVRLNVRADRDNQIARYTRLQQVSGPSLTFESSLATGGQAQAATRSMTTGGVTFETPANVTAAFSGERDCQAITLTVVEKSRTSAALPQGVFSSTIVQLTPFGVKLEPGGKLTFPNADGLPAGKEAKLVIVMMVMIVM